MKKSPLNTLIRYKNITINNLHCAINRFLFSLYYWFGLLSQTRYHIKNVKGATIIGKVYFVKEPVIIDIHLQEKS